MSLTKKQYIELADKLLGTSQNVYILASRLFGCKSFDDEDWDQLKKIGGVFKCEQCDEWMLVKEEEDKHVADMCRDCVDVIDGPSDLEEEE